MTIKLLAQYGRAPAGSIITLDSATEAALIAQGQATSNFAGGTPWTDPLTVANNPSTGVTIDGTGVLAGRARLNLSANWMDNTCVIFGDSHDARIGPIFTSRSGGPGYELADNLAGGAWAFYGLDGWLCTALMLSGWPLRILHNAAVGGETIAQANARMAAVFAKYQGVRFAVYGPGTNDAQSSSITTIATATAALNQAIADLQKGWATITGNGTVCLAATLPPRTGLSGFQRRVWAGINAWIRANVNKYPGVYLLADRAKGAGNPATGAWLANAEYGAVTSADFDTIHGTAYGYYLVGCEAAPRLQALLPFRRQGLAAPELAYDPTNGNTKQGNLVVNGKMLGTGGSNVAPATGPIPDSWLVQATPTAPTGGTIVCSKVARNIPSADATTVESLGEWLQVSMTGGTTEGVLQLRQQLSTSAQGPWAPGDVITGVLHFETDAANWSQNGVGALPPIVTIEFNANGGNGRVSFGQNAGAAVQGRIPAGTIRLPEAVIPPGTTDIWVRIYFRGQGTWRVSEVDVRYIPDRSATLI